MEPKTKGLGFINTRIFALDRFGEEGWAEVLAYLVPDDRRELESAVAVGWYPLALYARLIRAIDVVHGTGDLALLVQLGRFQAERDLTTVYRVFLRMASPAYLLEKQAEYWRRYHDTGAWSIVREAPTRVRAYLDKWGYVDAALCKELVGYVARAFELVGAKNVRMDHTHCRANGAERCEFVGRWNEGS